MFMRPVYSITAIVALLACIWAGAVGYYMLGAMFSLSALAVTALGIRDCYK